MDLDIFESTDIKCLLKSKGLFSFIQLERKLSNALGRKVDLVTKNSVSPHLKDVNSKRFEYTQLKGEA